MWGNDDGVRRHQIWVRVWEFRNRRSVSETLDTTGVEGNLSHSLLSKRVSNWKYRSCIEFFDLNGPLLTLKPFWSRVRWLKGISSGATHFGVH
jgi:hypothetical protein